MKRQPEPELMTDEIQALAYAKADFSEPHKHFVDLFRVHFATTAISGDILDLGCGTADVTWRFAEAFPETHVIGVDGSAAMLKFGHDIVTGLKLADRVELVQGYLPGAKLPREHFNYVISNSLLHHLADPALLWTLIKSYTKPGGGIFIMDLIRPDSEDDARRIVKTYSGGEHGVLQKDFYLSLLAAYTTNEIQEQLETAGLAHFNVQAVSDRHVVIAGRL